jgi:hypothetical protein
MTELAISFVDYIPEDGHEKPKCRTITCLHIIVCNYSDIVGMCTETCLSAWNMDDFKFKNSILHIVEDLFI